MKKSDEYKDIVVVPLTAVDAKTTLADDYIPKPMDLDKLMEIVEDNLSRIGVFEH